MKQRRLQELDRSDFEIVKGEPDIRGWDVKTPGGEKIGEVEELILDAQEKKVRYIVVDLSDNKLELDRKKVLIPIGLAELHERDDDVMIPRITWEQLEELPHYDRNHLTADVERNICSILDRKTSPAESRNETRYQPQPTAESSGSTMKEKETKFESRPVAASSSTGTQKDETKKEKEENDEVDPEFYRHEYYNLDNLYKNRLHEAQPVSQKRESEYETGLKLWERRSEGGIVPGETRQEAGAYPARKGSSREIDEEARMEMVRDRRNNYQQRRYRDENRDERK